MLSLFCFWHTRYRFSSAYGWLSKVPDEFVGFSQCDQMDILFLAIYNNGHLPNSIIIGPSSSKILPSTKLTLQKLSKTLNFSPKWQNLAKFGHTDGILASRRHFKSRANHHYSFSHNLIDTSFAIILW